jgi:S1-C subfamily serine protease
VLAAKLKPIYGQAPIQWATATATSNKNYVAISNFDCANLANAAAQKQLPQAAHFESAGATVVKVDAANDLALLKAVGAFTPLPIATSRTVKLGGTVATVGFPDIGLQGFAPKLAKGEIASLAGAADDPRYFQISLPVQPGRWSSSFSLFGRRETR